MRVKLLCLLFCFVFFLTGCSAEKEVQTNIKFDFLLNANGNEFFINAEVAEEYVKYTVLSPENISGLTLIFRDDVVETEFMNHQQSYPLERENFGVLGSLYGAFREVRGAGATKNGEEYIAEVNFDGELFLFSVTQLGIPISVKFNDTEIFFQNITNL